uniref:Uncharacterized protein n=1 Tax=Hucho hucho TaxID=62062 RepID=A0A4W5R1U9_9TELE
MPIWSMTCFQFRVEPSFFRLATNSSLIVMMRLAIPCTSPSLEREQSGVLRMVAAMRAPFMGGWDSTRLASSASLHTTVKPPTRSPEDITHHHTRPMFLASRSISPLAKPW